MPDGGARLGAEAAERLAAHGTVTIENGLSDDEFAGLEQTFGFEFADDHRDFLAAGLPVGGSWPNWRADGRRSLAKRLQLPVEGILFDVEMNAFWGADWGPRPAALKHALRTANYQLARVPRMIPVYSHRYLPSGRGSFGHPVLSMYQTDIVVYGDDLLDYIGREFAHGASRPPTATPTVEFWSDLVS